MFKIKAKQQSQDCLEIRYHTENVWQNTCKNFGFREMMDDIALMKYERNAL